MQPNTGYNQIRFPLVNQPNSGVGAYLTVIDHTFSSIEEGSGNITAPHLVNSEGIPFSVGDTMFIELNDIIAPTISIEGISTENNTSILDPDENIIIYSTESLLKDQDIICLLYTSPSPRDP